MSFKLRSGNTPLYRRLGIISRIGKVGDRIRSGISRFQQNRLNDPNRQGFFSAENVKKRMQRRADRRANPDTRGVHSTLGGLLTPQTLADQSSHIASNVGNEVDNVGAAAVANEIKMEDTSAFTKKKRKKAKPFKMKRKY
tara:strand:+ start:124 stop:543 length:420 start_codon:yes stop_codon:yes gene_type:complete